MRNSPACLSLLVLDELNRPGSIILIERRALRWNDYKIGHRYSICGLQVGNAFGIHNDKGGLLLRLVDQVENRILFVRLHNFEIGDPSAPLGPFGYGGIRIGVDDDDLRAFRQLGGENKSRSRFSRATLGLDERNDGHDVLLPYGCLHHCQYDSMNTCIALCMNTCIALCMYSAMHENEAFMPPGIQAPQDEVKDAMIAQCARRATPGPRQV